MRERFGQAYEQHVTAQSLEVGKPTQEVSKSNLWEFAQQIVLEPTQELRDGFPTGFHEGAVTLINCSRTEGGKAVR